MMHLRRFKDLSLDTTTSWSLGTNDGGKQLIKKGNKKKQNLRIIKSISCLKKTLLIFSSFVPSEIAQQFCIEGSATKAKNNLMLPGFTFIEIMIALMLLATFGTSLFMMQATIFQKVSKPHSTVASLLELDQEMINLKMQIVQAFKDQKELTSIKIHTQKHDPERSIDIVIKPIKETSALFKKFGKNVSVVQATTTREKQKNEWFTFLFTPPKVEEAAPKKAEVKK